MVIKKKNTFEPLNNQKQNNMKTLKDLFELVAKATEQNGGHLGDNNHWFIQFFGHVNNMSVTYYSTGWERNGGGHPDEIRSQRLDEEGIQVLYWFIKTRLK